MSRKTYGSEMFVDGARVMIVGHSAFVNGTRGTVAYTGSDGLVRIRWDNGVLGGGLAPHYLEYAQPLSKKKMKLKTLIKAYISKLRDDAVNTLHVEVPIDEVTQTSAAVKSSIAGELQFILDERELP